MDLIVNHDPDARSQDAGGEQAFGEVLQTIGVFEAEGRHRPGQDHGVGWCGELLFQQATGFDHGVGAMRDDNRAVNEFRLDDGEDQVAIGVGHEQTVLVEQRSYCHLNAGKPQGLQIAVNFLRHVFHLARALRINLFDGATRGDYMNFHAAKFLFSLVAVSAVAVGQTPSAVEIVKKSLAVDNRQEELRRDYTYDVLSETRELDDKGKVKKNNSTKTEVVSLGPKRLRLVVERDGKPLLPAEAEKERRKYEKAAQEVARMSPAEKAKRMAEQRREEAQERAKFQRIPEAFQFTLMGEPVLNGRPAWEIRAVPIRTYSGPWAFILKNMEGTLWIDKADSTWVKVEADTLGTVSFGWFLARLGKGTRMSFESNKVNDEIWAPSVITLRANARIALVKAVRVDQVLHFSRYRKFQADSRILSIEEVEK